MVMRNITNINYISFSPVTGKHKAAGNPARQNVFICLTVNQDVLMC